MPTPQYWKDLIQCVRNVQEASQFVYNLNYIIIEESRNYSSKAQLAEAVHC